jgi:uncharacterized protein YmfQ (DUF2313 family)
MTWGDYVGGFWGDYYPDSYLHHLQQLMPQGRIWTREPDADLTILLDALGMEYDRIGARALELIEEADVRTAVQLLSDFETLLQITNIAATYEGRQAAAHAALTKRTSSSIPSIIQIAENLGYTSVTITEDGDAFRVGYSAVGDALQQGYWLYHFTIHATRPASLSDDTQLTELVTDAAPLHTTFGLDIT